MHALSIRRVWVQLTPQKQNICHPVRRMFRVFKELAAPNWIKTVGVFANGLLTIRLASFIIESLATINLIGILVNDLLIGLLLIHLTITDILINILSSLSLVIVFICIPSIWRFSSLIL